MPVFKKKQNEEGRKRMQKQVYLAQENPEPTYDLSNCDMTEVPDGTFSVCKVIRKEALLLNNNRLSSLGGGGKMADLASIRVLDLHSNEFASLPDNICTLMSLQVLNVEGNKLKFLPANIGNLACLQTLNCKGNKMTDLPASVCSLRSLRTLDVSDNLMAKLPANLWKVRTLENLLTTPELMKYPQPGVCSKGTAAIMKKLCEDAGQEYIPPAQFLLDVLDPPSFSSSSSSVSAANHLEQQNREMENNAAMYAKVKHEQSLRQVALMEERQRQQAEDAVLAAQASRDRAGLLSALAQEQNKQEDELAELERRRRDQHTRIVKTVSEAEESANQLIEGLLAMQERTKNTDALLEQIELDRIELEQWFQVRQEEVQQLRKQEVIAAVQRQLKENEVFQEMMGRYLRDSDAQRLAFLNSEHASQQAVEDAMKGINAGHAALVQDLMLQEELQREAFAALQQDKDERHSRIVAQIALIEGELLQLSLLECQKRREKKEIEQALLAEKRLALSSLLVQLLDQKTQREKQLRHRLQEMEDSRDSEEGLYWLVQYQRLMDRKPAALMDRQSRLEKAVVTILNNARGEKYLPVFGLRSITIETLMQMTDADLRNIGVRESEIRSLILRGVEAYKKQVKSSGADAADDDLKKKKKQKPCPQTASQHPLPSAPSTGQLGEQGSPVTAVTARTEGECVVCLDKAPDQVFLPCGHVCCCSGCGSPLPLCPLCRAPVTQRVQLGG